jgi:hypothetical protein
MGAFTIILTILGLCVFESISSVDNAIINAEVLSDISKIPYLEIIDMTFSIDGVLGAFAFTLSVPLIIAGNGLGAIVVRQITVRNIERIKKLRFIKNGAMYSILVLGGVIGCDGFGVHVPQWVSPVSTFSIVGLFIARSLWELRPHPR